MKLKTVVAMALINIFALSFLWFVVEYGQRAVVMVSLMSNDRDFVVRINS
jgi:hypothetical protein